MVGIILASHGEFATGILQSASMIMGESKNVKALSIMPSESPEDLKNKMIDAISSFDTDQILFLVDIYSGTPFNQANSLIKEDEDKRCLIAGLNLPMLLEALGNQDLEKAHDLAKMIVSIAREEIKVKPESLDSTKEAKKIKMSENVVGNGKIEYVLARIDTRLLHGQVATSWTKTTNPNRIIVVSDNVSKDDLRKNMIKEASPAGIPANTIPISKLIEVDKDPRFGNTKAMLLFETVQDALKAIEGGVQIKELNLGSIAHSVGKIAITTSVALDNADIEVFKKLISLGIKIDVRKVPSDKPENIEYILEKAYKELNKN